MRKDNFKWLCILICLFLFNNQFKAQREADCIFNGGCIVGTEYCVGFQHGILFKFNEDSLEQIIEPVNINLVTVFSRATFSDKKGNLLFASNGWRLVNSRGDVLAERLWRDDILWPGDSPDTTMVLNNLGPLFLNDPGDSTKAYLLYGQYKRGGVFAPNVSKADVLFTYAYLDIPTQTLISKNNIIIDGLTGTADMQACRHANGRDWWVIKAGLYEDEYFIGLLDRNGIQMEQRSTPGLPHRGQVETLSFFSHNGNKFIHYTGRHNKYLHEYDFDRCTGVLSNVRVHNLGDSIVNGYPNACNISPDGSKFYISRGSNPPLYAAFLQYDLETQLWAKISTFGAAPLLAPNGKSILLDGGYIKEDGVYTMYISELLHPNEPFDEANFYYRKYTTANAPRFLMPSNYANFRLGALKGSGCDSIVGGINVVKTGSLKVYPNPNYGQLTIEFDSPALRTIHLYNSLGQRVFSIRTNRQTQNLDVSNMQINAGLFLIEAVDEENNDILKAKIIYEK